MAPKRRPAIERVLARVQTSTDPAACWIYRGALYGNGYGQTSEGTTKLLDNELDLPK